MTASDRSLCNEAFRVVADMENDCSTAERSAAERGAGMIPLVRLWAAWVLLKISDAATRLAKRLLPVV